MYTIEISYQTGDSFGSEDCLENIGWSFETKEEAQLVLLYIKENYIFNKELEEFNTYSNRNLSTKTLHDKYKDKAWYYKYYTTNTIKYKDRQISAFWIGYFETLYYAKVIHEIKENNEDIFYANSYKG